MKKNSKRDGSSSGSLENFRHLLSPEEFPLLENELQKALPPAIRLNLLKEDPVSIEQLVEQYGWDVQAVPYCRSGWQVSSARVPIAQTVEQRFGYYYIQEAASMLPAELFDFSTRDHPLILDMAASPGGKTTHLADRTGDRGLIIANDNSPDRITALRLILQTWGIVNQAITQFPGEMLGRWFPERFDYVLLDAPCSMQGLHTSASHPIRPVTPKEIGSLASRQVRLLTSALQAVKTGGQVVYSTCTLQPEENEAVLDEMLAEYPGHFVVENLKSILPIPAPALAADRDREFHPAVTHAARLWPHRYGTSGFFAALLTKTDPLPVETALEPPHANIGEHGYQPLSPFEFKQLVDSSLENYGFDLEAVLERFDLAIWVKGKSLYAFPESFFRSNFQLPVRSLGLMIGEFSPNGFIYSHEWVSRFFAHFTGQRGVLAPDQAESWLKGLDIRDAAFPFSTGTILVFTDQQGRFLGRGKLLADRIKNLVPRRSILQ